MAIQGGIEAKMELLQAQMEGGREDHVAEVELLQRTMKKAMVKKSFAEHDAMKMLLAFLDKREHAYTLILSEKKELLEMERRAMFEKRAEVRWLISFFDTEKTLKSIESRLDYQLDVDTAG